MKIKSVFVILLLALALSSFVIQAQVADKDEGKEAYDALQKAAGYMQEMASAGFSVIKVNDTITDATNLYNANLALEEKTGAADYSSVIDKVASIEGIKSDAFETYDELTALESKLKESAKNTNMSEAETIFEEAKKEFYDERYAQSSVLIETCYKKIIETEATSSRIRALYEASTKTLAGFFQRNGPTILIVLAVLLILFAIFKKRIYTHFIKRNIQRLGLEKEILGDLIKKAQTEYFQKATISEATYRVRINKFGELIRDINRRESILNIDLEGIHKKRGPIKRFLHNFGFFKTAEEKKAIIEKKKGKENLKKLKTEEERKVKEENKKKEEDERKKVEEERKAKKNMIKVQKELTKQLKKKKIIEEERKSKEKKVEKKAEKKKGKGLFYNWRMRRKERKEEKARKRAAEKRKRELERQIKIKTKQRKIAEAKAKKEEERKSKEKKVEKKAEKKKGKGLFYNWRMKRKERKEEKARKRAAEKRKRELEKQQKIDARKREERKRAEAVEDKKRAEEAKKRKIIDEKKRAEESRKAKIEQERKKKVDEERRKAEEKRKAKEKKKGKGILHALGLVKTKEEKAAIAAKKRAEEESRIREKKRKEEEKKRAEKKEEEEKMAKLQIKGRDYVQQMKKKKK